MKITCTAIILLSCILISCSSSEKSANPTPLNSLSSYEPITLAEFIGENPDSAKNYQWIDESKHEDIWKIVDEFPNLVNGLRPFHMGLIRTMLLDSNQTCQDYNGERVIFEFIVTEKGNVNQVHSVTGESSSCHELIKSEIKGMVYTPGSVNSEAVSVLYSIPITIQI